MSLHLGRIRRLKASLTEYINRDLEIKRKTINCLQTERVGHDEHNVAE